MQDKVCMVTGATSGIGRVTVRVLAERGATVILVGRSQSRGEAAVNAIRRHARNSVVEFMLADLSSRQDIRHLAARFVENYDRLDVLVNNAGALFRTRQESIDGIEMTFALNHLGYFHLTRLLLDVLKASAPSRIVNVASEAHRGRSLNFEDMEGRVIYQPYEAYGRSKLANIMFTYELARRLEGTAVTVNALHPGVVDTNFGASDAGLKTSLRRAARPWVRRVRRSGYISPEEGAQTQLYLATSTEVEGISGLYYDKCKAVPSSEVSYDAAAGKRLWRISEEMIGASFP